jgi:nucleoside 2-deoxyribosyltransferase
MPFEDKRKPRSLILAPFSPPGRRIRETLDRALEEIGIEVFKFEDIGPGAQLAYAIQDAIKSADFVVADITNQNANVLYELGAVHALRKPAILIASETSNDGIPPTLQGFFVIVYDPTDLNALAKRVQTAALRLADEAAQKYA